MFEDYIIVTRQNQAWRFWKNDGWTTDIATATGYETYAKSAQALYAIPNELILGGTTVGTRKAVEAAIQEIGG